MCKEAVQKRLCLLEYIPDWFVTQQQIKIWHDDAYYCNNDKLITWYEGYQKRKVPKAKIKKESNPGIHQDGGIDVLLKMKGGIQKHCGHKHERIKKYFLSIKFDPHPTLRA